MIVTLKELKRLYACSGEVARFEKLFGKSVRVTKKLCLKHAQDVDWDWAAWHLLKDDAWLAYLAARLPAWKVYWAARLPAWKVYEAATQSARAANERAAWEVYNVVRLPAWEDYRTAKALAFYKATLIK